MIRESHFWYENHIFIYFLYENHIFIYFWYENHGKSLDPDPGVPRGNFPINYPTAPCISIVFYNEFGGVINDPVLR